MAELTEKEIEKLGEEVVLTLETIYDPEIPVNIYELGLVYDVQVGDNGEVHTLMTLTTPNCPVAESLPKEVEDKIALIKGVTKSVVEVTFEPPWDTDMMTEEARFELGFL